MAHVDYFIPSGDPAADFDRYEFYKALDAQKEQDTNRYIYDWEESEEWETKENWWEISDRF